MTDAEFIESFRHCRKRNHWWYDFNPLCKLIVTLALGFTSMIVFRWQVGLSIFVLATIIAATTSAFRSYLKTIAIMFLMGCVLTVGVRLYVHMGDPGPVAFRLFGQPVPVAAVISCLDMVFMIEQRSPVSLWHIFYCRGNIKKHRKRCTGQSIPSEKTQRGDLSC